MPDAVPLLPTNTGNNTVDQFLQGIFGNKTTTEEGGSTETTTNNVSPEAITSIVRSLLEGGTNGVPGLANILGAQNATGGYNSTTAGLISNDLVSRIAGRVAEVTGSKTVTRSGQTNTSTTKNEGSSMAALLKALLSGQGGGSKGGSSGSGGVGSSNKSSSAPSSTGSTKSTNNLSQAQQNRNTYGNPDATNSEYGTNSSAQPFTSSELGQADEGGLFYQDPNQFSNIGDPSDFGIPEFTIEGDNNDWGSFGGGFTENIAGGDAPGLFDNGDYMGSGDDFDFGSLDDSSLFDIPSFDVYAD